MKEYSLSKLVEMKTFNGKTLCILFSVIPIVFPTNNETDDENVMSNSKHPYSNLWYFQRIIGFIGIFLNCLGKFTIQLFGYKNHFSIPAPSRSTIIKYLKTAFFH